MADLPPIFIIIMWWLVFKIALIKNDKFWNFDARFEELVADL